MEVRQQIESLHCGIVVVGQNKNVEQAEEWNTSGTFYTDFIHLCDPSKALYKAFGFDRSLSGVWGAASLDFYVAEQMSGRELHPSMGQDVNQMGGDILIDGAGTVTLPYYSKTNTDRPSVAQILEVLGSATHVRRR
jgi:hypothetical protein|eukprot:SAG25_NODE_48_length_18937_cov_1106.642637_13_plen_136_part_00